MASSTNRCRLAINLGWHTGVSQSPAEAPGIHTRCMLNADGHTRHVGVGLEEYADFQRFEWFDGDRRSYETDHSDVHAWEVGL